MGYFTSLMQQSGLRRSNPVRAQGTDSIETHVLRTAETQSSTVATSDAMKSRSVLSSPAGLGMVPRQGIQEQPLAAPREEGDLVGHATRVVAADRADPGRPARKRTTLERSIHEPLLSPTADEHSQERFEENVPQTPISPTPRDPVPDKPHNAARHSRVFTLADVRAWVSADTPDREEAVQEAPQAERLGKRETTPDMTLDAGGYTLEIGHIEVIVEPPAAPLPVPPASYPRPAPDHSWTLPSRHYVR